MPLRVDTGCGDTPKIRAAGSVIERELYFISTEI
jgi:hypothetical protein